MPSDRILVKDLRARGVIGVNEWERQTLQDILVSIALHTDLRRASTTDDVKDSIDYRLVVRSVMEHIETARHRTVEALAAEIARICVLEHGADQVWVRVEKPGAVRFARSVGVEIERRRTDFEA